MSKILRKALVAAPVALGAVLAASGDAVASDFETSTSDLLQQIESYSAEGNGSLGQDFPGASQFSDVSPSDWAFQALDDLVRRYDCLKGYPDGTYRGNRSLSRYEFAAGLNACLQQIERLIAETTAEFVTRDDLEVLRRLLQEFEAELATLGTRVDNLEGRVAFLEDNQFSTTTKLQGEIIAELNGVLMDERAFQIPGFNSSIFNAHVNNTLGGALVGQLDDINQFADLLDSGLGLTPLFEGVGVVDSVTLGQYLDPANPGADPNNLGDAQALAEAIIALEGLDRDPDDNLVFGYRARLNFDTSFFGTDRLRTRLQAANMNSLLGNDLGTTQAVRNLGDDTGNNVELNDLAYRFMVTDRVRAHIIPRGASIDDVLDSGTTAPFSGDNLALANSYNTLFYESGGDDQAFGLNVAVSDFFSFDIAYMADGGEDAALGIFGGEYVIPVQLNFDISDRFKLALGYSYSYLRGAAPGDDTSSFLGQNPFLFVNNAGNGFDLNGPLTASTYALNASWDPLDWMNISGYVGYSVATSEDDSGPRFGDNATYTSWGFNLGFPDIAKEGDVVVAGFGQLPTVTVDNGPDDSDATYIANLEYRFPLTENIELAPGVYAILNPNGNAANDTIFVGMFRTKLTF
ncbi:MAG: iron uptake porin [Spirulinaceae cyanobacterium SM2_1_0]|nr:iron uptake porin [Spirulinaceae cyanobacterium SM2_1_0]